MPLRLNVGLSKKVGQRDYGSLGASCHVEVELDGSMIQNDLEAFHRHVRNAFVACRQAVNDELARNLSASGDGENQAFPSSEAAQTDKNGGQATHRNGNGHRASNKQLDYPILRLR